MDTVCRLYTSGNVTSTSLENRGRKKKKKNKRPKEKRNDRRGLVSQGGDTPVFDDKCLLSRLAGYILHRLSG